MTDRITKPTNAVCARAFRSKVACNASVVTTGISRLLQSHADDSRQSCERFAAKQAWVHRDQMLRCSHAIFYRIFDPISIQGRVSDTRAITVGPLNLPSIGSRD